MTHDAVRSLRAVARTALTWGVAWAVAGGALVVAVNLVNPEPSVDSLPERVGVALFGGVALGVRFGIIGAAMGALFAALIRLSYRGRRLADIDPARFALLGAAVGGIGMPLFLQLMNVLSGDGPAAWGDVLDDVRWAAPFGAAAAAGTIWLARRADTVTPGTSDDTVPSGASGRSGTVVSTSADAACDDRALSAGTPGLAATEREPASRPVDPAVRAARWS